MRKIPDGAQWRGTHNGDTIYFKKDDGAFKYYLVDKFTATTTLGWRPLGTASMEYLHRHFDAVEITIEELMDDFISNEQCDDT